MEGLLRGLEGLGEGQCNRASGGLMASRCKCSQSGTQATYPPTDALCQLTPYSLIILFVVLLFFFSPFSILLGFPPLFFHLLISPQFYSLDLFSYLPINYSTSARYHHASVSLPLSVPLSLSLFLRVNNFLRFSQFLFRSPCACNNLIFATFCQFLWTFYSTF